ALDGVGRRQDVTVADHALEQAGLREDREVRGVAALGLDDDLLLELTRAVVLDGDPGALGARLEGVLELVGLLLGDRAEEGDGLAVERAVLLEGRAVGVGAGAPAGVGLGVAAAPAATATAAEVVRAPTRAEDEGQAGSTRQQHPGPLVLEHLHRSPPTTSSYRHTQRVHASNKLL